MGSRHHDDCDSQCQNQVDPPDDQIPCLFAALLNLISSILEADRYDAPHVVNQVVDLIREPFDPIWHEDKDEEPIRVAKTV